jgi:hypothetical protein
MELSLDQKHGHCCVCQEWKCLGIDTVLFVNEHDYRHDEIICLRCDNRIGFRKDVKWMHIGGEVINGFNDSAV